MRVMVFGTFDNLHPGHLSYFAQARDFGEDLVAVVARDKNVIRQKGRPPLEDEKTRLRRVRLALGPKGGKVLLGNIRDQYSVIRRLRPDVIALGYDQTVDMRRLKSEIAGSHLHCKIKRLKAYRPDKYKSSYYRKDR